MHDWVLVSINLSWASAKVEIEFVDSESKRRKMVAEDLSFINIPRRSPWGGSVSVNEVSRETVEENRVRLLIEIQSGDVIELEAGSISEC
jgi:hypothetical protein